jgi:hypothetical protein
MTGSANANRRVAPTLEDVDRAKVLLLSTSLLTDRMLIYTGFLEHLTQHAAVEIWAGSRIAGSAQQAWDSVDADVQPMPAVRPFKEFPYNYLRRMNEFAWDHKLKPPSRLSAELHTRQNRSTLVKAMRLPGKLVAALGLEQGFEARLEKWLGRYPRSPESATRLSQHRPDLLVTTNPFWFSEPAVSAVAAQLKIPTLALIPSWDNITTKTRLIFRYDGYLVWSEQAREELLAYYPQASDVPIYVIGAPQFDILMQGRFEESRGDFCRRIGLDPAKQIILYVLGSPNFLQEHYGAMEMARQLTAGRFGDAQMIVRPHPIHDRGSIAEAFRVFGPRIIVQQTRQAELGTTERSQSEDDIREWVNSFRHADVVVNLASTSTIDGAIFDRPVVNLDFDPNPSQKQQALVRDVNHVWSHFKPVAESGAVWLVNDYAELTKAIGTYLARPELHRSERRAICKQVCGHVDGRCGERMAEAVLDFVTNHVNAGRPVR